MLYAIGLILTIVIIYVILKLRVKLNTKFNSCVKTILFLDKATFESYCKNFDPDKILYITIRSNIDDRIHNVDRSKYKVLDLVFEDDFKDFSEQHAYEILYFLQKHLTCEIDQIIVSCQMGISRSPAIALALAMLLNASIFPDVISYNEYVFSVCEKVFKL